MLHTAIALRALSVASLVLLVSWSLRGLIDSGDWTWLVFTGIGLLAAAVTWYTGNSLIEKPPRKLTVEDYEVPF